MKLVLVFLVIVALANAETKRKRSVGTGTSKLHYQDPVASQRSLVDRQTRSSLKKVDDDSDGDTTDRPSELSEWFDGEKPSKDRFTDLMKEMYSGFIRDTDDSESGEDNSNGLFSHLFGRLQPWWKGPNICIREDDYEEEPTQSENDILESFSITASSTQCYTTDKIHKCIMKFGKKGKTQVHTVTRECCHGYEREEGRQGCPRELNLKPLLETLRDMNMTSFVEAVENLGLTQKLTEGNYTLFVPMPEAFSEVAEKEGISGVVLEPNDKMQFVRDILQNHIVGNWTTSSDFFDEMVIHTEVPDATLRINYYLYPNSFITASCARITSLDNRASNGIIHVVDRLLLPAKQTLAQILETDPALSAFRALLSDDDMKMLNDPEVHYTLLAFNNDAYDALSPEIRDRISKKHECLEGLVKEHLLPSTICSTAIQGRAYVRNLADRFLNLSRSENDKEVVLIEDGQILTADRMATNGAIHIINTVLLSSQMLDGLTAMEKNQRQVFTNLIKTTGIRNQISGLSQKTIFVPPEEDLKELAKNHDDEDLRKIILGHVVDEPIQLTVNSECSKIKTLGGTNLTLRVEPVLGLGFGHGVSARAAVQCANIIKANIKICDGVLHYIDRVLQNPTKNLLETLRSSANYSQLLMLIEAAGLDAEISGDEFKGTILAPSNAAFEEFGQAQIDKLLTNRDALIKFLKNHILEEEVCCNGLGGDFWIRNRHVTQARTILPSYNYGLIRRIGRAGIESCDLLATNGIIHGVDTVLKPRTTPRLMFPSLQALMNDV